MIFLHTGFFRPRFSHSGKYSLVGHFRKNVTQKNAKMSHILKYVYTFENNMNPLPKDFSKTKSANPFLFDSPVLPFNAHLYVGEILLMDKILHQLIGSLSRYLQDFIHTRRCRSSSINSISS